MITPGRATQPGGQRGSLAARAGWAALGGSAAVLVLASLVADGIAFGAKEACRAGAWNVGVEQYQAHCYTDIYPLYYGEGLASGKIPYLDHHVEYPVVIGAVMQGAAWLVRSISNPFARGLQYFDVTVAVLALFLVAGVLGTAYCAGPARRWTALLVAFSPALILSAFINWDLIAMGLMMMALAAWAARRPVLAGILLGLAVATKFYPIVVLWPLLLLCLRAGRLRAFFVTDRLGGCSLAGREPACRHRSAAGVGDLLHLQQQPGRRLGRDLVLLPVPALAGPRHYVDGGTQPAVGGRVRCRLRWRSGCWPWRPRGGRGWRS